GLETDEIRCRRAGLERVVDTVAEARDGCLLCLFESGWKCIEGASEGRRGNERPCLRVRRLPQQRQGADRVGVVAEDMMDLDGMDAGLQLDIVTDLVDRHRTDELAIAAGALVNLEAVDEHEGSVVSVGKEAID